MTCGRMQIDSGAALESSLDSMTACWTKDLATCTHGVINNIIKLFFFSCLVLEPGIFIAYDFMIIEIILYYKVINEYVTLCMLKQLMHDVRNVVRKPLVRLGSGKQMYFYTVYTYSIGKRRGLFSFVYNS